MQTEKQRERLVELITEFENNKIVRCPKYNDPTCEGCEYDLGDECDKTSILADHLIANNVMVLPLKVGDRIYRLDVLNDKIIDWTIERIDIYGEEVVYCDDCFNEFTDEEFGVRGGVFLTLEEAEKALNERMLEEKENENQTMR